MFADFLKRNFKRQPPASDSKNEPTDTNDNERIRKKLSQDVKATQRDKRDKMINSRRDMGDSKTTDSHQEANSTYVVANETNKSVMSKSDSNRRRLFEEWRKKKKENDTRQASKPVFKVHHVDNKLLAQKSMVPSSSTFNFHMKPDPPVCKRALTMGNLHAGKNTSVTTREQVPRPVTRSQSKVEVTKPAPTKPVAPKLPKSNAPTRSGSSLTEAKRPPVPETRKPGVPSHIVTKKMAPKAPVNPPKPILNSTANDIHHDLEHISSKMGSAVVISSTPGANQQRLSNRIITPSLSCIGPAPSNNIEQNIPKSKTPEKSERTLPLDSTPEFPKSISPPKTARMDAAYFDSIEVDKRDVGYYKNLVDFKTRSLYGFCNEWEDICSEAPEDIQGDIRSACGLAKLLIDERFDQFSDLIRQCETSQAILQDCKESGITPLVVKCSDLQGFWDMVEYQVQDVTLRFEYLKRLKEAGYVKTAEIVEYFEKKMSNNKPKELETHKKVGERGRTNRNYLKKKNQVETNSEENKSQEVVSKPAKPAQSRFAQFRAAKLQQTNAVATDDVSIEIKIAPPPKTPLKQVNIDDSFNSAQKTGPKSGRRRKSNVVVEPNRYNLRSRPSDLIKFDSPVRASLMPSRASIMPSNLPTTIEEDSSMNMTVKPFDPFTPSKPKEEDKENEEVFDYLGAYGSVGVAPINFLTLKLRPSIAPSTSNAFTPQRRVSHVRESLEPDRIINLSRSPLLKLALISSHSKRLSTSRPVDLTPF